MAIVNAPTEARQLKDNLREQHLELIRRRDELLADGATMPEEITSEDEAREVADFRKMLYRHFETDCEAARKSAKAPYLDASRTVDNYFSEELQKPTRTLWEKLTAVAKVWLDKEEARKRAILAEERRKREEEERKAREAARKAEEKARSERALAQAAELREEAERAEKARIEAEAAEAVKPADLTRTKGEFGGSMRSAEVWLNKPFDKADLTLKDLERLLPHIHQTALEVAVRSFIKAGGRELDGVEIYESRKVM